MTDQTKTIPFDEIEWELHVEPDELPVRGFFATGEDELDRKLEDEIIERLDRSDVWAWACVTLVGRWHGLKARDSLGGCSYEDEADFCQPGGYYDDMRNEVAAELSRRADPARQGPLADLHEHEARCYPNEHRAIAECRCRTATEYRAARAARKLSDKAQL